MKRYIFLFIVLIFNGVSAQDFVDKEYLPSDALLSNPERGFYHHTEVHSANYQLLNVETLKSYKEEEHITLILRVFYLEDFVGKPISQSYLNNMKRDFNILREAGLKAVVRFAYTKRTSSPYGDAKPEMVYTHVKQLKEVFDAHSDVISVVQTGLVGAWGEWYYTDHFAGFSPSDIKPEHWEARGQVVKELLDALPEHRMIQLRTPNYKMKIFGTQDPLTSAVAFDGSDIARVGHHNDCFVASANDVGTYNNASLEKPYLEEETKYTAMGGETCGLAPPYSDCEFAVSELRRFHWSYLNIDYHGGVLNGWKDQGCFDDVEKYLGYRYVLSKARLYAKINKSGVFNFEFDIENVGYANPFNYRNFRLMLKNIDTGKAYFLDVDEDIRLWSIGEVFTVNVQAGLHSNVEEGDYQVYISFPDGHPNLSRDKAYNIQLANEGMWDEETGFHDLELRLNVDSENEGSAYLGEMFFTEEESGRAEVNGPVEVFGGLGSGSNLIFWGKDSTFLNRRIWRSEDGKPFESIGLIPSNIDHFQDVEVEDGVGYEYKYVLERDGEFSSESEVVRLIANFSQMDIPQIKVDGVDTEWQDVKPVLSGLDNDYNAYVVRSHFSVDSLFMGIYGEVENYELYLDTDNNIETGEVEGDYNDGADYLIRGGELLHFENGDWVLNGNVSISFNEGFIEIGFGYGQFENFGENTVVPLSANINDGNVILGSVIQDPSYIIRKLPPDLPQDFAVGNSIAFPDSRLEVTWTECERCDLYVLEKSIDGDEYTLLKELSASKAFYYDDFLENGTYFYRIKSRNELGWSMYSEVKSGIIGGSSTQEVYSQYLPLQFSPNPVFSSIRFDNSLDNLEVYNFSGKLMASYQQAIKELNVAHFSPGLYVLKSSSKDQVYISKFLKM